MNGSRDNRLTLILQMAQLGLLLAGVCLLASMLLMLGLSLFLLVEEPRGVAVQILRDNSKYGEFINPQPQVILPTNTNVVVVDPMLAEGLLRGVASQAATWVNGKSCESGAGAAWEMLRGSWRLWLMGIVILVAHRFVSRYRNSPAAPGSE